MKRLRIQELPEAAVSHNRKIRKQVMVSPGELPGLNQYARAVFPPGEKAGEHLHNDLAEIFTVESGCGEIRINNVSYVFNAGTMVLVEPGERHEIMNTGNAELVVTYFSVAVSGR